MPELNLVTASQEACKHRTLIDALTWIAVWETERIVKQARSNEQWDTCFRICFQQVFDDWARLNKTT